MIVLQVSQTGKSPNPKDVWRCFNEYSKYFETLDDAKAYLKEEYFYCKKRVPCYQDFHEISVQTGWIYCFIVTDYDKGKKYTYYQQDWCTFGVENREPIDVRGK